VDCQQTFTAWGTEVHGKSGKVGAPRATRVQLVHLGLLALSLPVLSKELLQSLLGSLVYPLSHRKVLMSHLGRTYTFVSNAPEKVGIKLPHDVKQELLGAVLSLCVAETDIRAPVSTLITASDATPQTAAVVQATVSRPCAEALYDLAEHRGEYARLDWSSDHWNLARCAPRVLPVWVSEMVEAANWVVTKSISYKRTSHVNLTEGKSQGCTFLCFHEGPG
jgi:hypothetical protein